MEIFGQISLFFLGVISTIVYYPQEKKRNLAQKAPKSDRTLVTQEVLINTNMIIAGDIGGTKVDLALFQSERTPLYQAKYKSQEYNDFASLLKQFIASCPSRHFKAACFGVAGSVQEGKCHTTNLPWVIDADALKKEFSIPNVALINDLEANAWGIRLLNPNELITLNHGRSRQGNAALIAAGTGLGEAGLYWDGKHHYPFATEGGHADFAPTNEEELALWNYLKPRFGHLSYERVLSGVGIFRIYQFLVDTGRCPPNPNLQTLSESDQPQKIITEQAVQNRCSTCVKTLYHFVSIYGTEAGNLALKMLSTHTFYIGGGIAPRVIDILKNGLFMKAFTAKGRFQSLLADIPVKVILNDQTALFGAAEYARNHC